MIKRFAYVLNNATIWGPGPNPYFITLRNGTMWELSAHTREENEEVGIFEVEQVDYREIDSRFMGADVPEYSIVSGRPRETWTYFFIPAARQNMLFAVDEHAEALRAKITTQFAGQYAEYDRVYAEALEVSELPSTAIIEKGDFPYLDSDIGVTYSEELGREVKNVFEAADLVIETRRQWDTAGARIRTARLAAKKLIRDAESDEQAFEVYENYIRDNS